LAKILPSGQDLQGAPTRVHRLQGPSPAQGINLFIGRLTHRLFRDAGVVDLRVDAVELNLRRR